MPDDHETFRRGAEHFAGARLELAEDEGAAWVLTADGHRLGALHWDPRTDARWDAVSASGRWAFEWHGRWPRRFFARDEDGEPAAWFVGRRLRRGGDVVLADGTGADLRPLLRPGRWGLDADGGERLATLAHQGSGAGAPIAVELERAAAGHPALTMVLLTACAVVRLDRAYSAAGGGGGD
ncbi:MAG TPA: hypothetical protein VNB64_10360 [Solirubrobacteraceae bacterium]|nr:hypothetical protein [Solirubrobacteraceae bacterium]